jgi:hypothetical protein
MAKHNTRIPVFPWRTRHLRLGFEHARSLAYSQKERQAMEKQYVAPELKLAGDAHKVVLGLSLPGTDMFGSDIGGSKEFDDDDLTPGAE